MYPVRSPLTHSLTRSVQELYEDYTGFASGEKLTYKTDVFGIGQLMWNMLMNFSEWYGAPFYDNDGTAGAYVVNGVPYDNHQLSKEAGLFLTGNTPYEASSYYSEDLKDLVRRCLRYRQEDRPTLEELNEEIDWFRKAGTENRAPGNVQIAVEKEMGVFRVGQEVVDTSEVEENPAPDLQLGPDSDSDPDR
jgi:serine/threonine protein kinase